MAEPLRLMVWTPSETLLDVEPLEWVHVELAQARGLTIWPGHLPMLGETASAPVRYADHGGTHAVELPPGIVQVQDRTVTLFLTSTTGERSPELGEQAGQFSRLSEALLTSLAQEGHPGNQLPAE